MASERETMIRIQTTAEFDADGKFTGQTTEPVPPGSYTIEIVVPDSPSVAFTDQLDEPMYVEQHGLLLLNVKPLPDALIDMRELIQQERNERNRSVLGELSQ